MQNQQVTFNFCYSCTVSAFVIVLEEDVMVSKVGTFWVAYETNIDFFVDVIHLVIITFFIGVSHHFHSAFLYEVHYRQS